MNNEAYYETLAELRNKNYIFPNIAKWMKKNGITATDISRLIGVTRPTISNYLTGVREPKFYFICEILRLSGMTFEVAFERKEEQ